MKNTTKKVLELKQISIQINESDEFSIEDVIKRAGLRELYKPEQMDDVYRAITDMLKMFERGEMVIVLEGKKANTVGKSTKGKQSLRGRPAKMYKSLRNISIVVTPKDMTDTCPTCGREF